MARPRPSAQRGEDRRTIGEGAPNAAWFKPIMFGFMLVGLLWIVVFYISNALLPIPAIGSFNILIGFGIAFIGFLMTLWWR